MSLSEVLSVRLLEVDTGRADQLGHDDTLGAVDDEGALVGHQREVAHEDRLALDLAGLVVHELGGDEQRRGVGDVALLALVDRVLRRLEPVIAERQRHGAAEVLDRRDLLEDLLQAGLGVDVGSALVQRRRRRGCARLRCRRASQMNRSADRADLELPWVRRSSRRRSGRWVILLCSSRRCARRPTVVLPRARRWSVCFQRMLNGPSQISLKRVDKFAWANPQYRCERRFGQGPERSRTRAVKFPTALAGSILFDSRATRGNVAAFRPLPAPSSSTMCRRPVSWTPARDGLFLTPFGLTGRDLRPSRHRWAPP